MNPRSPYGWMVLGGLVCLFGMVAVVKWRDAGQVRAQSTQPEDDNIPVIAPPAALPPIGAEVLSAPPSAATPSVKIVKTSGVTSPPPKDTVPLGSDPRPILIPPSATQSNAVPPDEKALVPPAPVVVVSPPDYAPTPPPLDFKIDPPPVQVNSNSVTPAKVEAPKDVTEPPLAPRPGPVITFRLSQSGETFRTLAKKTLNNPERWTEIHKLNPNVKADAVLVAGTVVRLPADACVGDDDSVRQLPSMRPRPAPKVRTAFPLTGTFPLTLDDKHGLTLPKAVLAQLGNADTVLLSPGSDKCLWLTNQAHLDRMAAKLEKSPARESDVQGFKRLYYAQTVKATVKDGRIVINDRLAGFAGLHQELVLVGIDDHFEVWDAARWRHYVHVKKSKTAD